MHLPPRVALHAATMRSVKDDVQRALPTTFEVDDDRHSTSDTTPMTMCALMACALSVLIMVCKSRNVSYRIYIRIDMC